MATMLYTTTAEHCRNLLRAGMLLAALLCLLIPASTYAQAASESFRLSTGAVVAGQGSSSGGLSQIEGVLPQNPGGLVAEDRLALYSGNIAMIHGIGGRFLAFQVGNRIDTLEVATQDLSAVFGGGYGVPSAATR